MAPRDACIGHSDHGTDRTIHHYQRHIFDMVDFGRQVPTGDKAMTSLIPLQHDADAISSRKHQELWS